MTYSLIWLPDVLQSAGLRVALVPGWESAGRGPAGPTYGVLCHHTAGNAKGNMPSLEVLIKGRGDVPGPLCQLGIGRDGTFYVIAAGRANHAGKGMWQGLTTANTNFIGIEAENTGLPTDPWPAVQLEAYQRGVAAILKYIGRTADFCAGHKEYALPKGRKEDPTFDMDEFRARVAAFMAGAAPPALIPRIESTGNARLTLRRGMSDPLVDVVQQKLGIQRADIFGPKTEAAVREFQRQHGLVPDGVVGPTTWAALDRI